MIRTMTRHIRSIVHYALMWALVLCVCACGGGSTTNDTRQTLSNSEYLGTWHPVNSSCQSNFYYNPALYVGGAKLVVSEQTLQTTVTAYSDSACTQAVGTLTRNYALTASLANVANKDNVAKWSITLLNNAYTTTIPSLTRTPGILTEPEFLDLADVDAGLLYRGEQTSARDANGFPTALQNSASYTRTAPADTTIKVTSVTVNGNSVDITQPIHIKRGDGLKITSDKATTFGVASFKNGTSIQTTVQYLDEAKGVNTPTWFGAVLSEPGSTLQVFYTNASTQALVPFSNLNIQVDDVPVDNNVSVTSIAVNGAPVDITQAISVKNGDALQITTDKVTSFGVASFKNGASIQTTIQYLDNAKGINTKTWSGAVYSEPGSTLQVSYIDAATQSFKLFSNISINIESAYQGTWSASYNGGDSGFCANLSVSKTGAISAICSSTSLGANTTVTGSIDARGGANFASGTASTGATFSGSFGAQTATGRWTNPVYNINGTWEASKR